MKSRTTMRDSRKRILIVDDHPYLREGVAKVIDQQDDLMVCGQAATAREGLAAFAKQRPDAVIVDISLEEGCGLDLIKNLCTQDGHLPVLAFSMHHENLYAERAIHAGARGYVMKREPEEVLLAALRKVLRGQVALSDNMVSRLVGARNRGKDPVSGSPAELLSDRELEVFRLYGEGLGTSQISARLHITVNTVESYRSTIKQKLGLGNATELVARAARFVTAESA